MAVAPQSLERNLNREADELELAIDSLLKGQKLYKGGSLTVSPPRGMSTTHFNIIRERYKAAGWSDVTWHDDQRDGAYITFTF